MNTPNFVEITMLLSFGYLGPFLCTIFFIFLPLFYYICHFYIKEINPISNKPRRCLWYVWLSLFPMRYLNEKLMEGICLRPWWQLAPKEHQHLDNVGNSSVWAVCKPPRTVAIASTWVLTSPLTPDYIFFKFYSDKSM